MAEITAERQRQICDELAQAMGWTVAESEEAKGCFFIRDANGQHHPSPRGTAFLFGSEELAWSEAGLNPFTSAEDSRALVEWLATKATSTQDAFDAELLKLQADEPDDLRSLSLWYLTASLPVIALAAHRALGLEVKE